MLGYIEKTCKDVIADRYVRQKVYALNQEAVKRTRIHAKEQLDQILRDELGGCLITLNNYYTENIDKFRRARQLNKLKERNAGGGGDDRTVQNGPNYDHLINERHLSNDTAAVYEIHDKLKAYYKVAMKRFIDNVAIQVTERYYMDDNGPLAFFSPAYIGELNDQELQRIAGENETTTNARNSLNVLLKQLEEALKLAEEHR